MAINCGSIEQQLSKLGIPTDRPDFFNNQNWVNYVGENLKILETFASFVRCRAYSGEYLENAERVIRTAAETLHAEILSDGRFVVYVTCLVYHSRDRRFDEGRVSEIIFPVKQ